MWIREIERKGWKISPLILQQLCFNAQYHGLFMIPRRISSASFRSASTPKPGGLADLGRIRIAIDI